MTSDIHRPLGYQKPKSDKPALKSVSRDNWLAVSTILICLMGATYAAFQSAPLVGAGQTDINIASSGISVENGVQIVENSALDQASGGQSETTHQSAGDIITTRTNDGLQITTIKPSSTTGTSQILNVGQDLRLAHLPDERIVNDTDYGPLPIIGANGERAFDIYARPWSGARGTRIAIVVGGLGLSQTVSNYAINELSEDITLAFAANGNSLQRWMQGARRKGHEILLQVPMEPMDYPNNNPGRGTLEVGLDTSGNLNLLHEAMGRITNYTGVGNFMGARFLSDSTAMEPIMQDIANRGLMFFDDGTTASSQSEVLAQAYNMPFAASDILLDAVVDKDAILKKLDDLERIARLNGQAIGVASASPDVIDAIKLWSLEAKTRSIEIVGLSALATDPQRR